VSPGQYKYLSSFDFWNVARGLDTVNESVIGALMWTGGIRDGGWGPVACV